MNNAHVWRAAQERLRNTHKIKSAEFETWLRGTELVSVSAEGAVLRARTTFAQTMLETRYREAIETALREVTGYRCPLTVRVADAGELEPESHAQPQTRVSHSLSINRRAPHTAEQRDDGLARPSLFAPDAQDPSASGALPAVNDDAMARGGGEHDQANKVADPRDGGAQRDSAQREALASARRLRLVVGDQRGRLPEASQRARLRNALSRIPTPPDSQPANAEGHDGRGGGVSALWGNVGGRTPEAADNTIGEHPGEHASEGTASVGALEGEAQMSTGARHDDADDYGESYGDDYGESYGKGGTGDDARSERHGPYAAPGFPPGYSSAGPVSTPGVSPLTPPRLNPRYRFSTFIVGKSNQFAHAASRSVADAPGHAYNPLFLYGGVGLGKTHLLHAIGHSALDNNLVVLYVSSETFTNEIINAIRYRTTDEFRAKYRSVDVLLVDDIQFIAGKDSTEEEFFHTFNSLYESNKQIVICSDRPPKAIVSLEERLRSRFEWGLQADIQPPDLETRVAILRAKADLMGRKTPDEIINFLAARVQSNIRELEGSLNRLLAYADLQGLPLTSETAKAALASLADDGRARRVSIADILEVVADHYSLKMDDLRGKQRDKHIVMPRQVAMYLMRQETEASLLEIGQALGGRDHSTVLHGWEKINREINENTALRKEITAILQDLQGE